MDVKSGLIGVMFPEKFDFDGKSYRTNSYNKVLDIIYQQTNELRGQKKRDSSDFPEKSLQVPPQGLDCATCRCAVVCSKVYTLPTSLKGRRSQGSRSKRVHKKKEKIFIFPFPVPLDVLFSKEFQDDLMRIWNLRYLIPDPEIYNKDTSQPTFH